MASIYITDSANTVAYELPSEVGAVLTIGTAEDCSISLPSAEGLSELHCRITRMEDGYAIADSGSETGVFADARRVASEYMAPGITYRAGQLSFVFVEDASEPPASNQDAVQEPGTVVRTAARRKTAAARPTGLSPEELKAAAEKYKRDSNRQKATLLYIVIVILAAFYAGMALYSWKTTGNPLPVFLR